MKIGEIIEVEGVQYIAQREKLACRGCYFDSQTKIDCYKEYGCKSQDNVIFVEIPLELLRKIEQLEKAKKVFEKNEEIFNENNKRYLERAVHIDTLLKELKMYQENLNILENFSGLLGKQYLFKQDDGTYYNRYTEEYMTEEEAIDWLYSKLSEVINK